MAIVGYARVSTVDQLAGYEAQVRDLNALDCDKIYKEQVSSVGARPQLDAALDYVRDGDTFIVTKVDRLARSTLHLMQIVDRLKAKGVHLRILDLNIDTTTATGELILGMIASIAQFERRMMLERQREGIEQAKTKGRYKGRAPLNPNIAAAIIVDLGQGLGVAEVARKHEVARSTVYKVRASSDQLAG